MLGTTIRLVVLLIFFSGQLSCQGLGHYWRDYTGEVPSDAIVGGLESNHTNAYIGQGYLQNVGLLPLHISPGAKQLYVAYFGIKPVQYVKILCGSQDAFIWVPTNLRNLTSLSSEALIGGHREDFGVTYIGRTSSENGTKIGRADSYHSQGQTLHFNNDGVEKKIRPFEVLVSREAYCKSCK